MVTEGIGHSISWHRSIDRLAAQGHHRLFEDLSVGPLELLAVHINRLVPRPHVVDKLLVLGLGGVELSELVALVVGGDIESGEGLLATDDESAADDGVVADTENGGSSEDELAASLETGEETTYSLLANAYRKTL